MEELLKQHMFAAHAVAATGAVALASSLTHPLDTLKSLLQVLDSRWTLRKCCIEFDLCREFQLTVYCSFSLQMIHTRLACMYLLGLYSGFGWSTVGKFSGMGARFGIYEVLTAFYKDGREDNYVYVSEALSAGIAAGAVEALISTPFELFKLREQVNSASYLQRTFPAKVVEGNTISSKLLPGYNPDVKAFSQTVGLLSALPKHSNMVDGLKGYPWMLAGSGRPPLASEVKGPFNVISLEGWGALWRGLRSGIARDSIFGGVFFSTWQFLHIAMLDWKAIDMNPPPRSIDEIGSVSPLAASLAAGFSGSLAAVASHCFDTAKTRSQCVVTPKYITMERKFLRWNMPGIWLERVTGIHPRDRSILFRGIGLRMARSGITSFAIVGSYLLVVNYFV
ncbi:hypothetical protein Taro_004552 [Colocasia esculenta]|uniref:Uncharacterized protein n=1 Tax=Colocasia esculenta TaxID=4460 RepID=A0A843TVA1_COLES|nr:hypothetical protein [Colocasia esculenta]